MRQKALMVAHRAHLGNTEDRVIVVPGAVGCRMSAHSKGRPAMKFTDQIKAKAEELNLSGKLDQLGDAASKAMTDAKHKAGSVAHDQKDKVENLLDKAGSVIDGRTDGKYADKVAKAKQKAGGLVDKVASHRPDADPPPDEPKAPDA
jgi:MT0933-like antitoxin protein